MLETMTLDPWRQPHDQALRVATLFVRCREHRITFDCSAVITHAEERSDKTQSFADLAERRIRFARYKLMRTLVPFRFRRRMACL
jgi:hypothetical protein